MFLAYPSYNVCYTYFHLISVDRQDLYQEFVVRDDGIHEVSLVNPLFMGVNQPVKFHIQVRLMHHSCKCFSEIFLGFRFCSLLAPYKFVLLYIEIYILYHIGVQSK